MTSLGENVDILDKLRKSKSEQSKRWVGGQGFKPYLKNRKEPSDRKLVNINWIADERFIAPRDLKKNPFPIEAECRTISDYLLKAGYRLDKLYSRPPEALFDPPLVLVNQGFTECSFFDYPIRFRSSLHVIAGPKDDEDLLIFLTYYLRSKLAQYYLFHTSANWGTERNKVHLNELLRLPFPLPGSEDISPEAQNIVHEVATLARKLKTRLDILGIADSPSKKFKLDGGGNFSEKYKRGVIEEYELKIEPLIYRYFDLIDQEIFLIEDTVEVSIKSSTPQKITSKIPTLKYIQKNTLPIYKNGLSVYANVLVDTLNGWARNSIGEVRVSAVGSVDGTNGLALIHLEQSSKSQSYREETLSCGLGDVLVQLNNETRQQRGKLDYLRGLLWFDETGIRIIKPCTVEYWTRTAALNDAAEIYARIVNARRTGQGELM